MKPRPPKTPRVLSSKSRFSSRTGVDVQPRAPLDQSFHAVPPVVWRIVARRSLVFTTLLYGLEATMRGAGSSRVRLKPDSRYQVVPTSTGPRRDPHTAISSCGVSRRLMGTQKGDPPRSPPQRSTPRPSLRNEKKCAVNNDCQAGFCVDGVCCNTACTGVCQACTAVKKGSGVDGVCGNIAAGTDPDNECPVQMQNTCGTTGQCSGVGTCVLYPAGTPCGQSMTCNGSGVCM
jgi:hypothetical protein